MMMIKQRPLDRGGVGEIDSDADVPSESSQAIAEFAACVRLNSGQLAARPRESYEIHPCQRVRGFILRIPVTKWRLWYPSATAAVAFAEKLAKFYKADCRVYDSAGQAIRT